MKVAWYIPKEAVRFLVEFKNKCNKFLVIISIIQIPSIPAKYRNQNCLIIFIFIIISLTLSFKPVPPLLNTPQFELVIITDNFRTNDHTLNIHVFKMRLHVFDVMIPVLDYSGISAMICMCTFLIPSIGCATVFCLTARLFIESDSNFCCVYARRI